MLNDPLFNINNGIMLPTLAGTNFMLEVDGLIRNGEKITQEISKNILSKYFTIK